MTNPKTKAADNAIDLALDVLKKFREAGVVQEQLDSARNYAKGL
jgi:hypothetical protein